MNRKMGFTLIELVATLVVAAIIVAWGLPSFRNLIVSNRLVSQTNELIGALNLARSEAIKRGSTVSVCKSKNGTQCNSSSVCTGGASGSVGWSDGWIVFLNNATGSGTDARCVDANEQIIRTHGAFPDQFTLNSNSSFSDLISYRSNGVSNNTGIFVVCYSNRLDSSRTVVINQSGRVRAGMDSNNNGIPEKEDGTEITSCTSP